MGTATSYLTQPPRPVGFTLRCQGNNAQGQVGKDGNPLKEANYLAEAAAGVCHSLVVTTRGEVLTWGSNLYGQLGCGTAGEEAVPDPVLLVFKGLRRPPTIRRVAASFGHSVALSDEGVVYTWGLGSDGQLGYQLLLTNSYVVQGSKDRCQLSPRRVEIVDRVEDVACGKNFTVLLSTQGRVLACGSGLWGVLGNGRLSQQFSPEPVAGELAEKRACRIACGWSHCVASVSGRGIYSWGRPYLEISSDMDLSPIPQLLLEVNADILSLACGQNHSAAIVKPPNQSACVLTWGSNGFGQLGYASEESIVLTPRAVETGPGWKVEGLACGWNYTVALGSDGRVKGWGGNKYSQFGARTESAQPAFLGIQQVTEVVSGYSHLLFLRTPSETLV